MDRAAAPLHAVLDLEFLEELQAIDPSRGCGRD
jgi:hypothetical protein